MSILVVMEQRAVQGPPAWSRMSWETLAAGQHVDFQITLDHIPSDWNRQYPSIRIVGLVLQ